MKVGDLGNWPKTLFTYGPFAILVFMFFVAEGKARRAMKEARVEDAKTFTIVYVLNWVVIFGLIIFSVFAWSWLNLKLEPTIKGRIENLKGGDNITTNTANMFLWRHIISLDRSDFEWRLEGIKRFAEGEKVTIILVPEPPKSTGTSEDAIVKGEADIKNYELTIRSEFYDHDVRIVYRRDQKKMFVHEDGKEVELPETTQLLAGTQTEPDSEFFMTVAHAQDTFREADFRSSLESSDVVVRRYARTDLAKQGQAGLNFVEEVLAEPKSSYRLKLGVIVALNNMPNLRVDGLKHKTIEAIQVAAADSDEALRNEALGFLAKHNLARNATMPVTVCEHINFGGRCQGFGPGSYRANRKELGNLPNDTASSIRVMTGYKARLCDSEGKGNGSGICQTIAAGSYQLKTGSNGISDRVSFIEVIKQ
jgi:hypothetical protein